MFTRSEVIAITVQRFMYPSYYATTASKLILINSRVLKRIALFTTRDTRSAGCVT